MVSLNRKLNLVLHVDTEKGRIYIHSVPIGRLIFEDNFLVIGRAFTAIYTNGLGPVAGPRVAALLLKQEAQTLGIWERTQQSLINEIYRLTNVLVAGERGWETMPYDVARKRSLIDEDAAALVENAIVYFTCASSIHMETELGMALDGLRQLWNAQTSSLNATEYMRSLPTSTPVETTGEKPAVTATNQSSIPV